MSFVWGWLLVHLPWWAWGIAAVAFWVALAVLVAVLFGAKYARLMLWPVVALVGALVIYVRARQDGYAERKQEEQGAVDSAVDDFKQHEKAVDEKPIEQIDKENAPWLKP